MDTPSFSTLLRWLIELPEQFWNLDMPKYRVVHKIMLNTEILSIMVLYSNTIKVGPGY